MRNIILSTAVISSLCWADGAGVNERVQVNLRSPSELEASTTTIRFDLTNIEEQVAVTDTDLNVVHEKILHVFVFDKGLGEFQHIHPEYADGEWSVEATFARSGDYLMWAQGQLRDGDHDFISNIPLIIVNGSEPNPVPPVLTDIRSGSDGLSVATLSGTRFRAGREAMPNVTFTRTDGTTPVLEPYLGEKAHVVITPSDAHSLIHTHPMDHGIENQIMLHTTFPEAGFYKIWIQFIDEGQLRTVPLSVEVFE